MEVAWGIKRERRDGEFYMRFVLNSEGSWSRKKIIRDMYSLLPVQVFKAIFLCFGISLSLCVLVFIREKINCFRFNHYAKRVHIEHLDHAITENRNVILWKYL